MTRTFPIARMDGLFTTLTGVLLVLPAGIAVVALAAPVVALPMLGTALAMVAVYAAVYLAMRPSRFALGEDGLQVVFPLWTRTVPWATIRGARLFRGDSYTHEVGWGLRVGAGGLWGVFGWLVRPGDTVETWVSRREDLVRLTCEGRHDLLVSPADAEAFTAAVQARVGA